MLIIKNIFFIVSFKIEKNKQKNIHMRRTLFLIKRPRCTMDNLQWLSSDEKEVSLFSDEKEDSSNSIVRSPEKITKFVQVESIRLKKKPFIGTEENRLRYVEEKQKELLDEKDDILKTEDTGKMFEMAICLAYNIPYDGKYKYSMSIPTRLKSRLVKLTELFPKCYHTAKRGSRYDFTSVDNSEFHLSAKTTKKGVGKVAPQVIGQSQPEKFCKMLDIPFSTIDNLKEYLQKNMSSVLYKMENYTFDCPNIYYNEGTNEITYICKLEDKPIKWEEYEYVWTCNWELWTNSSTLKIKTPKGYVSLVEFQFHTKSRTNMAIRWFYENVLNTFKGHFEMVSL